MGSSPSWSDGISLDDPVSPSRLRASSSPAGSWSSDPKDHVPLDQRRVARRAPARGRRRTAGPSRRPGTATPADISSTVTGQDLASIRACYQIPREVGLFIPTPDDRVISSRSGRVAIYEVSLRLGLRPPFPQFYLNLLDYYFLTPSQLVPNSLRTICAFMVLCHLHGLAPRVSLFRYLYFLRQQSGWWLFQPRPGRVLKLHLPTSVKGWKSRFFFADIHRVRPGWGDPNLRPNGDSSAQPGDRVALGILLSAQIPRCGQLLSEENLRLAGISAGRVMKIPAHKMKQAALKRVRAHQSEGEERAPSPKRQAVRVSPDRASPVGDPVDLTADTPPEVGRSREAEGPPALTAEPSAQTEEPPAPTWVGSPVEDAGEGPSRAAPSPPTEVPAVGPEPAMVSPDSPTAEATREDEARGALPPRRTPLMDDGRRAERVLAQVALPEFQEEFRSLGASSFFREAASALLKSVNFLVSAKEVIMGGEEVIREARQEAEDAVARARKDRERLNAALSQLTGAQDEVSARGMHIAELDSALRAAEARALGAEEMAREAASQAAEAEAKAREAASQAAEAVDAAEARAEAAEARTKALEARIETAEERVKIFEEAVEERVRAVEEAAEARVVAARATAIEEYKKSEDFEEELTEASTEAYLQGFREGKEKVARVCNFPPALEVELDQPEASGDDHSAADP